jgi:hypothetical protein
MMGSSCEVRESGWMDLVEWREDIDEISFLRGHNIKLLLRV